MPKRKLIEQRDDFRGGLNTSVNPDKLNANELVLATNARLLEPYGAIVKRTGTRRLHTTAIASGADVLGLIQWDASTGKQIVAIAGGKLYHKIEAATNFTEVTPGGGDEFSTTAPTILVPFRDKDASAALVLYLASGGKMYKWTGSTLTRIDGTANAPTATMLAAYHTRLFARNSTKPKSLFWSKVGYGADWAIGGITDGGEGLIDTLSGDEIITLEIIGGSLLVATKDSIVRFTGYSSDDIRIEQDTQGVSADIGVIGPLAWTRVARNAVVFVAPEGVFLASEAEVMPIGLQIEVTLNDANITAFPTMVVTKHQRRAEVWIAYPQTSGNKYMLVYSERLNCWMGPWIFPFDIYCMSRYVDSSGVERVMAGCGDGFVRLMDGDAYIKDDVTYDGTGGVAIPMTVELAPIFFETGAGIEKSLRHIHIQASTYGCSLNVKHAFDSGSFTSTAVAAMATPIMQDFRLDVAGSGNRLRIQLYDESTSAYGPQINGVMVTAYDMNRP